MNAHHAKTTSPNFNQRNAPKFGRKCNSATPKIFGVTYELTSMVGGFHSILIRRTLGGQLWIYFCFVPCRTKQISSNCIYFLANTRSIPIINNLIRYCVASISIYYVGKCSLQDHTNSKLLIINAITKCSQMSKMSIKLYSSLN